jgi:DNA polymerase-3 subunit delta
MAAATAGWSPQDLGNSIRKKELYPLYFLYGDDTFLLREALAELEKMALGEGLRDFNLNTFYGDEAEGAELRDAIETLPMMAAARVVVLKEAQSLKEREWDALMPLIERPLDSSTLICVANKIDKRKKYAKRFLENGVVVEFKRPFESQIPGWIATLAKRRGLRMGAEAVGALHEIVGSNLADLDAEVAKLAQYVGEREEALVEDVMKAASRARVDSIFELTDAIGSDDRARALTCLANLLDQGQSEVGALALVSRHVRILKTVSDGMREGLAGQKLGARAGVSPYFLKAYVDQSRRWSDRKIEQTFRALLDTDRALKSSPVASHIWLENFIIQTCKA